MPRSRTQLCTSVLLGGRGCTNPYSIIARATSPNNRFCPPCIRYALLLREYSRKYSNKIWLEGHSTDRNPPTCSHVSACTAPSVISDRSMVAVAFSGSACGGASAIHRSPSNPFSVSHCLASSENAMEPVSSSRVCWSVLKLSSVHLGANPFSHACFKENSRNVIPSHAFAFCRFILLEPSFLDSCACISSAIISMCPVPRF